MWRAAMAPLALLVLGTLDAPGVLGFVLQNRKAVEPVAPPAKEASVATEAECASLKKLIEGVASEDSPVDSLKCSLVVYTGDVPEGCECRVVRSKGLNGGKCPLDCSDTGGPACVAPEAHNLGITGLSASGPLHVPSVGTAAVKEAALCMYWHWSSKGPAELTSEKAEKARVAANSQQRVLEMVKNAEAIAQENAADAAAALWAMTPAPWPVAFPAGPTLVELGTSVSSSRQIGAGSGSGAGAGSGSEVSAVKAAATLRGSGKKVHKVHHLHGRVGVQHRIFHAEGKYLGKLEVIEEMLPARSEDEAPRYLRTLMTERVAQSTAVLKCSKEKEMRGNKGPWYMGDDCELDNGKPDPVQRAFLRNSLTAPLSFVRFPDPTIPKARTVLLGFGAGTVPMFARKHLGEQVLHLTAVDIDPEAVEVARQFFGVPLPAHHMRFSIMEAHNPDKKLDQRCTDDFRLCVRVQDGMDYLKGMPAQSIDLLMVDCMGGDAKGPDWLNPDTRLREFVQEAKRTAQVVLVNAATSGKTGPRSHDVEVWEQGGFSRVIPFGFDGEDLSAIRHELCPETNDCGQWNRFLVAVAKEGNSPQEAERAAAKLDNVVDLGTAIRVQELFAPGR